MAKRYWKAHFSTSYTGTDEEESVDLLDDFTAEELKEMSDEDALRHVEEIAWEHAKDLIESYAEPDDEKNAESSIRQ